MSKCSGLKIGTIISPKIKFNSIFFCESTYRSDLISNGRSLFDSRLGNIVYVLGTRVLEVDGIGSIFRD